MRVSDLRDHSEHFDACLDILYERTKALARISPAPMHLVKEMSHLTPWTKKDLLASLIDLSDPACVYAWITHTLGVSAFLYPDSFDRERVAALIDRVKNDTKRLAARARALIPDSSLAKSIETIQEEERDYLLLHLPGLAKDILDQRDTAPLAAATVERMISSATDPAFAHQLLSVHLSSSLEDILTTVKRAS